MSSSAKARVLRDAMSYLSVCLFVCRLWNLWSHSLRGSTWR